MYALPLCVRTNDRRESRHRFRCSHGVPVLERLVDMTTNQDQVCERLRSAMRKETWNSLDAAALHNVGGQRPGSEVGRSRTPNKSVGSLVKFSAHSEALSSPHHSPWIPDGRGSHPFPNTNPLDSVPALLKLTLPSRPKICVLVLLGGPDSSPKLCHGDTRTIATRFLRHYLYLRVIQAETEAKHKMHESKSESESKSKVLAPAVRLRDEFPPSV